MFACCDPPASNTEELVAEKPSADPVPLAAQEVFEPEKQEEIKDEVLEETKVKEPEKTVVVEVSAPVPTAEEPLPDGKLIIVLGAKGKPDVTICFESRPLGLGFGPAPAPGCCGAPQVSKMVVTNVDSKKENLKEAKSGMFYKSINGLDVQAMEWTDFKGLLKQEATKLPESQ